MTHMLQSTLEASGIEYPALRDHIPCMVHVMQMTLGAFMSSLSAKGHTKYWKAHERNQQFRDYESIVIGMSQRLRKEGNAQINEVSAMRPGLAKIIENVHIWRCFESPETHLHIAENAWCIDYADTKSSQQVHWLSTSQSPNHGTTYYGCEEMLDFDTRVAWESLPITYIHLRVALESKMWWLLATHHNTV